MAANPYAIMNRSVCLADFLTDEQIQQAAEIFESRDLSTVDRLEAEVITPNITEINRKLGQENHARFLAYAVVYIFSEATKLAVAEAKRE